MKNLFTNILSVALVAACVTSANAGMYITEWMYKGDGGEFIEFTNCGDEPIDMTGWQFHDDRYPGDQTEGYDLSGFGTVQPGESVILTEDTAADFRADWGLDASVKIVGELGVNAGKNIGGDDAINLVDGQGTLVDSLDYDKDGAGQFATSGVSGNILCDNLGADAPELAVESFVGDQFGSIASVNGDVANPGTSCCIPEPATAGLLALAGLAVIRRR